MNHCWIHGVTWLKIGFKRFVENFTSLLNLIMDTPASIKPYMGIFGKFMCFYLWCTRKRGTHTFSITSDHETIKLRSYEYHPSNETTELIADRYGLSHPSHPTYPPEQCACGDCDECLLQDSNWVKQLLLETHESWDDEQNNIQNEQDIGGTSHQNPISEYDDVDDRKTCDITNRSSFVTEVSTMSNKHRHDDKIRIEHNGQSIMTFSVWSTESICPPIFRFDVYIIHSLLKGLFLRNWSYLTNNTYHRLCTRFISHIHIDRDAIRMAISYPLFEDILSNKNPEMSDNLERRDATTELFGNYKETNAHRRKLRYTPRGYI